MCPRRTTPALGRVCLLCAHAANPTKMETQPHELGPSFGGRGRDILSLFPGRGSRSTPRPFPLFPLTPSLPSFLHSKSAEKCIFCLSQRQYQCTVLHSRHTQEGRTCSNNTSVHSNPQKTTIPCADWPTVLLFPTVWVHCARGGGVIPPPPAQASPLGGGQLKPPLQNGFHRQGSPTPMNCRLGGSRECHSCSAHAGSISRGVFFFVRLVRGADEQVTLGIWAKTRVHVVADIQNKLLGCPLPEERDCSDH